MRISAAYLIFCHITLVKVRGVGAPCYSLVRVEVEAFVGIGVVEP